MMRSPRTAEWKLEEPLGSETRAESEPRPPIRTNIGTIRKHEHEHQE